MRVRGRITDNPSGGTGAAPADDGLERLRRAGDELLAAADEVISRTLSGNSERFLRSNRQTGGQ